MRGLFPSLHGYERAWLRGDLTAGLTVWAVLVPEALAYAAIAGVSPVVGLYAAPGALILYAALGSSRQLVTGPMAATAALSAATVAALVPGGGHRFAAFTAGLALTTRARRGAGRIAAAGVSGDVDQRAGAEGIHRGARADDHRRAAAEALRRRQGRRELLRAGVAPSPRARPHRRHDAPGRRALARGDRRPRAASRRPCAARSSPSGSGSPRSTRSRSTADAVRARVLSAARTDGVRAVVLDAETIPFVDVTAARMLAELGEELAHRGLRLLVARDVGQVRDVLRTVAENPALTHAYPTNQAAVTAAEDLP